MKKLLFLLSFIQILFGVDIAMTQSPNDSNITITTTQKVFGANLFRGKFSNIRQYRYNPNYQINIGDNIEIMFWGAYNSQFKVVVDNQGNIFIPQVGIVHLLGVKAKDLNLIIQKAVKKVFKSNVSVYANLLNYQPVTVFVAGSVNKAGLYEGLSSDSVIQFLDKAGGIDLNSGSFRDIYIKRDNKVIQRVDLYNFLVNGDLKLFQFKNGDIIFVDTLKNYIYVNGDVKRDYRFEIKNKKTDLKEVIKLALPNKNVTNVMIYHYQNNNLITKKVSINDINTTIYSGDKIEFISENNAYQITINLEGEITGTHSLVVKKGTTLQAVLEMINYSPLANKKALQLYRKSIAILQKQLIDSQLKDLESRVLTNASVTTAGATIQKEEAKLIMDFIKRARTIQPKGRVVLNDKTDLNEVILEDGDTIYIPKQNSIITIQGEVKIPGAQTYVKNYTLKDYIDSVGGYTDRADKEHILIIKPNGKVFSFNDDKFFKKDVIISKGDSILVLGKPNSENLQITKDITQILYQIAVSAGVVLRLF